VKGDVIDVVINNEWW